MAVSAVPKTGLRPEALMELHLGLLLISLDERMHREPRGTLNATRYPLCVRQSCQPHSLRMAGEVLYVPAMVNGILHIFHLCLPCPLRNFKTAEEVQMLHRDQEQEVNLQVQAGAHSFARLRPLRVGKQAIEPTLIGFTIPPSVRLFILFILLVYFLFLLCAQFK